MNNAELKKERSLLYNKLEKLEEDGKKASNGDKECILINKRLDAIENIIGTN